MNGKTIIILISGIFLFFVGGLFFFSSQKKPTTISLIPTPAKIEVKTPSKTTQEYVDPAGFAFVYPDDLTLEKKQTTDSAVYADLVLRGKITDGMASFTVKDTEYTSVDAYVKANNLNKATDIKIGDLNAKEIESKESIQTIAVDKNILFVFKTIGKDKDYWKSVANTIKSSFIFVSPTVAATSTGDAVFEDSVQFEGEEIVE